jgi:hypothetical protein
VDFLVEKFKSSEFDFLRNNLEKRFCCKISNLLLFFLQRLKSEALL